jgi:2-methylcitrate dehydratase PrpD
LSISQQLVQLIHKKSVTAQDREAAALFTLDAVANIVAGQNSDQGRILLEWARQQGSSTGNNVHDAGRRALLLGGLCHILEMDDLHRTSVVHPGCIVIPAVWGLVESGRVSASGHAILDAVLAGFEASTRVGIAVGPEHYRIFHNTATCGPFGSAFAAGELLGLEENALVDALGNAGTQAAGLWQFIDTGAMSKHLHAGRGAEAGVVSAELAAQGFTGPPEIFEGTRGFFAGLAPLGDATQVVGNPDAPWQLIGTSIKPFPSCRHTHPVIDACSDIRRQILEDGASIDSVESINIETYQTAIDICDRPTPDSVYEAKFSLQHCASVGLTNAEVDFAAFDSEARDANRRLAGKVELLASPDFDGSYPDHWGCNVVARLSDGRTIEVSRTDALGDPEAALSKNEMISKARKLMEFGGLAEPDQLIENILAMAHDGPLPRAPI